MAEPTPNLTPAQAHARRRLQHGMRYLEAGDLQAAGNALLQAVRLDDTLALAHYQLGNCLRRYGDNARAEQALLAAMQNDAALNDAYISLAYLYHETGRDPDAGLILEKLLATRPDDVSLRFQLGGLLVKFGLFSAAESIFANCPLSDARHAQAQLTLGNAYQAAGQFERAQQAFLKAIDLNANSDAAYLRIAHTRRFGPGDSALIGKFERILAQPDLSAATHVCLHFSLGKIYDDLASYDQAFEHYRRGNELQHERVKFDREQLLDYIARAKQVFTAEILHSAAPAPANATPQPIFVIGMLRSGTTLVERILASHPECCGLGETELVDALTRDLTAQTGKSYPECARALTPALCTRHAAALRSAWPAPAHHHAHVIDKNPLNFLHLGLISLLFPGAPVMHCVRDPLDTCLSIYFQHFAHPRNTYAYALDDIAFFYRQYQELMAYWQQVLPAPVHTVRYEDLVREPDRQTRALVTAAGLDWDPACLESHKHTERIETASAWQARQPIYSASAGRWRRYAHHLDGLREALGKVQE
ncbi:MAG: sulfotransferase [Gammaproteobacteria bacterium]|nr:sulfotransferase [Gammaproteobacteria bacterium]